MNETLDLPDWDDLDWDNVMKRALASAASTPKISPKNQPSQKITSTTDSDHEWLKRSTKDFTSYGERRRGSDSDHYLSENEAMTQSKPPLSNQSYRSSPPTRRKEQENIEFINKISVQPPPSSQIKEVYRSEATSFPQENVLKTLVLEFRSLFLSSSEQLKSISKFLSLVKDSIIQEADFNQKEISHLITSTFSNEKVKFHIPFRKLHQRYPLLIPMEEISMFDESYHLLATSLTDSIQQIGKSFDMKKNHYLQQLRKLKEVSNTAIRNAIQNERSDTINAFQRLKQNCEQLLQSERAKLEEERKHILQEKHVIEEDYLRVKMHLEEMIEKDKITSLRQQDAIKHALKEQKFEHQEEIKRTRETMMQDLQRVKDDFHHQIEVIKHTHEASIAEVKKSEREKRELVEESRVRLEEECNLLRKENAQFSSQLTSLREQFTRSMQEMRDKHTREIQERAAIDIQSQATIKSELATTLQRVQKEEHRRKQELEEQFDKMRQQLMTNHALEVEKLQDRHRSELKRIQAELEAQHQESVYKLKHIHEQELNRQIRENDRLQRLLARQGVATAVIAESGNFNLRPASSTTTSAYPSSPKREKAPIYHSLTPQRKPTRDEDTSFIKPLTKTENKVKVEEKREETQMKEGVSKGNNPTGVSSSASMSRQLNWGGFLEKDERLPKFSSDHLPPDPLVLNEAMEAAKTKQGSVNTVGISSNANRVTSYLTQLEDYLQGKEVRVEDEVKQITDPTERKNYILSSLHDDEEEEDVDSDSLGGQGMNLAQLAQLPLEISANSEWYSNGGERNKDSDNSDLLFPFVDSSSNNPLNINQSNSTALGSSTELNTSSLFQFSNYNNRK